MTAPVLAFEPAVTQRRPPSASSYRDEASKGESRLRRRSPLSLFHTAPCSPPSHPLRHASHLHRTSYTMSESWLDEEGALTDAVRPPLPPTSPELILSPQFERVLREVFLRFASVHKDTTSAITAGEATEDEGEVEESYDVYSNERSCSREDLEGFSKATNGQSKFLSYDRARSSNSRRVGTAPMLTFPLCRA